MSFVCTRRTGRCSALLALSLVLLAHFARAATPANSSESGRIAYLSPAGPYWQVWVMNGDGSAPKQLTRSPYEKAHLSWFPDGKSVLVNALDGHLYRVDAETGAEQPIPLELPGAVDATVSPDGQTIALSLSATRGLDSNEIWTARSDGRELKRELTLPGYQHDPEWSPDGKALYFLSGSGIEAHDIWRLDLATKSLEQQTVGSLFHFEVAVAPDGTLAFSSNRSGAYDLWLQTKDGKARPLTDDPALDGGASWSADGKSLVFYSSRSGALELWRVDALDTASPRFTQLTHTAQGARGPAWWHPRGRGK